MKKSLQDLKEFLSQDFVYTLAKMNFLEYLVV